MSEQIDDTGNASSLSEVDVIHFLKSHPNFFSEHSDLLQQLSIPHQTGKGVVSLIEKQIQLMRRQIQDLEKKLVETSHKDALHLQLVDRVHRLALELLGSKTPKALYQRLSQGLLTEYKADQTRFFVFTRLPILGDSGEIRFRKTNSKIRYLFSGVFNHHRPLCGSLQDEHIKALFGNDAHTIHSTVLIPIKRERWEGLLALGSRQWNCYQHGVALELLVMLSDMTGSLMDGWLRHPSRG